MSTSFGTIALGAALGLLLGSCRCGGAAPVVTAAPPPGPVPAAPLGQTLVLATLPAEGPRQLPPEPAGLGLHTELTVRTEYLFAARGGGVAWTVEWPGGFQVVWNGRPGKLYAAVGAIALSPDGRRAAHGALLDGAWRMVVDGQEGAAFSAVQAPVFSPDGAHLAYLGMAGERWHLVVDSTVSGGTTTRYQGHEFSGDGARIAFITDVDQAGWGRLVVSDLAFKAQVTVAGRARGLEVNSDRTALAAVSEAGGKQRALWLRFDRPGSVQSGPPAAAISSLAFGQGEALAYVAERDGLRFMVLRDREEPVAPGELAGRPVVRPGQEAVGYLLTSGGGTALHQAFGGAGLQQVVYDEAEDLAYRGDGLHSVFAARRGGSWFVVLDGKEGPAHDRIVSPVFSPDGRYVVYRARRGGGRFVVVADLEGKTVRQHPAYEQVFPLRFPDDGTSVAYGVKDGPRLAWKEEPL